MEWTENILRKFGQNLLLQPTYRVVWSETRMEWRFGQQEPKYDYEKCFVLERYCGPEVYANQVGGKEAWEEGVHGPFPNLGDYEEVYRFSQNDGLDSRLPLNPSTLELYARLIERGRTSTRTMRWRAIREREEKKKRDREVLFDALWNDSKPAPHAKIPEHIQRAFNGGHDVMSAEEMRKQLGYTGKGPRQRDN